MKQVNRNEPHHKKTYLMTYVDSKGADPPAHPRSLSNTFIVHCLESIVHVVDMYEIARLQLASVVEQDGFSLTWSHTSEDRILMTWLKCYMQR